MKRFVFLTTFLCLLASLSLEGAEPAIDADFPGGNIIVHEIQGDTVRLQQDLRDTKGFWFYWSFRVRGAQGRKLNFEFKNDVIGARGPAVSNDNGVRWRWLGDLGFSRNKFQYEFGAEENDVLFSVGMNYTQRDLERFLEQYKDRPELVVETLCKTKKGRDVELLRIPCKNDPKFKVVLSCRNHCCEMMASYVVEGMIDTVLSDTSDGRWLRENTDFLIVPFVDKDGVEDGDQGKNRKPHDHNRDYKLEIHETVKAFKERVVPWLDGKPVFFLDNHCPWLRGGDDPTKLEKGTNEYVYFVGMDGDPKRWDRLQRFGKILETEKKSTIPYKASFNMPFGVSWNTKANYGGPDEQKCDEWGATLPKAVYAGAVEIPYANASGAVVDQKSAREFGRDFGRAIRVYLETTGQSEEQNRSVKIDADFPGGNIRFDKIDGDTVHLKQDLRDTGGSWFYWSFRIRGAEGRKLKFQFTENVVGPRGPAVSKDGGATWTWLAEKPGHDWKRFHYEFGPDDKEVFFGMSMNYTQKDWDLFMETYKNHPSLERGVLCKTKKGRDVERVRISCTKSTPDFKVFLSSRNHCCEMMATYALEGIVETVLSDTEDGRWLREHADFFIVPLVDKDGVEDGDQGKNRKPHDHNRDYILRTYPEVAAITEQVPKWLDGRPVFFLDMHCPWLRSGDDGDRPEKGTNEYAYFVGSPNEDRWNELRRYGDILEKERKGPIPYKASFNLPYGVAWNKASNVGDNKQKCSSWGGTLPGVVFASSIEVPYANSSGATVDAASARALGGDLARAMRVYLRDCLEGAEKQ